MFRYESELVDSVVDCLNGGDYLDAFFSKFDSYKVFTEVGLGYGIADIVVTALEDVLCNRKNQLDSLHVLLLRIINKNLSISLESIVDKTKVSKRKLKDSLTVLKDEGFIKFENDQYSPAKQYEKITQKTVAIEAKLKNWKRALNQAYRYKWFSEISYVCLPSENIGPAKLHIEEFKKLEVGLMSFDNDNKFDFIYSPPSAKPFDDDMSVLFNEHALTSICAFG